MKFPIQIRLSMFLVVLSFSATTMLYAQLNQGGIPRSFVFSISPEKETLILPSPDLEKLRAEDELAPIPYRYAVNLPTDIDPDRSGVWMTAMDGSLVWRVAIKATGALALTLYFDRFRLPDGGKLFIYNPNRTQLLGAFTALNNNSGNRFATELIHGDELTLEYNAPAGLKEKPVIHLSEVAYAYRGVRGAARVPGDFGQAGLCEVNINCSEGNYWQAHKRGVVRISVKRSGSSFWCTGSLINNARYDRKQYILTADHCGVYTTENDWNQWIFYFGFESLLCPNPIMEPASNTMTGGKRIAHGGDGGNTGSDFFLMLLNEPVPDSYNVYYSGWSREDIPSPSGVGIHHPQGDIKKISTYTTPLQTSNWNGNPYLSHWKVTWNVTVNGHGVTERGSSGSPILDDNGRIVGTLTGGDSQCDTGHLNAPDYYGKFSWHWDQNGTDSASCLKFWLDPDNTGVMALDGMLVSIGENPAATPLKVFPNPFSTELTIELPVTDRVCSIGLFDLFGNKLFSRDYTGDSPRLIKLDLQSVSSGLYLVKVASAKETRIVKVLKLF